jgi:hypothetical protein
MVLPALLAFIGRLTGQFADKLFSRNMGFMLLGHTGLVVFNRPCQLFSGEFPRLLNVDAMLMLSAAPEHKRNATGCFVPLDVMDSDVVVHSF